MYSFNPMWGYGELKTKNKKKLGYGGLKKNTGVFGVLLPFISFFLFCK